MICLTTLWSKTFDETHLFGYKTDCCGKSNNRKTKKPRTMVFLGSPFKNKKNIYSLK
jgi:hypothetical protein